MNLGNAADWSLFLGMSVAGMTVGVAMWRLARGANRLDMTMTTLSSTQKELADRLNEHLHSFSAHQTEQAKMLGDLQLAVQKLGWEVDRLKGDK